jgi:hypothetical protein
MNFALENAVQELVEQVTNLLSGKTEVKIIRDGTTGTKISKIYVQSRDRY